MAKNFEKQKVEKPKSQIPYILAAIDVNNTKFQCFVPIYKNKKTRYKFIKLSLISFTHMCFIDRSNFEKYLASFVYNMY